MNVPGTRLYDVLLLLRIRDAALAIVSALGEGGPSPDDWEALHDALNDYDDRDHPAEDIRISTEAKMDWSEWRYRRQRHAAERAALR